MTSADDQTDKPATEEHGVRDTTELDTPADGPPEQSTGGDEPQPDGVVPKAGYPKLDPRHEDKHYRP